MQQNLLTAKKRSAFTMIEVVISIFIMAVFITEFTKIVFFVSDNQNMLRTREIAQDQLWSVLEMVPTHYKEGQTPVPSDAMRKLVENALPDGQLEFQCVPPEESELPKNAILLKGTVSWNDGENRSRKHVSLLRMLYVEHDITEQP